MQTQTVSGRRLREQMLRQQGRVIWLTGLSGAGKTTLAYALESLLLTNGYLSTVLDGDQLRTGLNHSLGFSLADRLENVHRTAQVARLNLDNGLVTITSLITPTAEMRTLARSVIGDSDFLEVYVDAPLAVCEQRDVKGLYARARRGELRQFTGIDSPYEAPRTPFLTLETSRYSVEACVRQLYNCLEPYIRYQLF